MNFTILILIVSLVCYPILAEILSWSWTDTTNRITIIDANTTNTDDKVASRDAYLRGIMYADPMSLEKISEIAYKVIIYFNI